MLPVKVDDTELDGLPPNGGYLSIEMGIVLLKKLKT
jgi:hypothetical protein